MTKSRFKTLRAFLLRRILRIIPIRDPWERLHVEVPVRQFGLSEGADFAQFLHRPSAVLVHSLCEIQQWLAECIVDPTSSGEIWREPDRFEYTRCGDCKDFALWAWCKLIKLDFDVDLVSGHHLPDPSNHPRHVWLVFRTVDDEYLYEPMWGVEPRAIQRLDAVRHAYRPDLGIDRNQRRFAYAGVLQSLQDDKLSQAH